MSAVGDLGLGHRDRAAMVLDHHLEEWAVELDAALPLECSHVRLGHAAAHARRPVTPVTGAPVGD